MGHHGSVTAALSFDRAPAQLIVVHLSSQELVAYQDGCPILRTPVTTGRPALPTGRGTFHIFYKSRSYHMVSPWPDGSPFHYPPTWVYNAMEFIGDGTFIHNADWQPDASAGAYWNSFVSDLRVFEVHPDSIALRGALSMKDLYVTEGSADWRWSWSPVIRRSVMALDSSGNVFVYAISDAGIRVASLGSLDLPLASAKFPRH